LTKPLSILVIGAGAIGTYIGGSLALAGHDTVFIDRPDVVKVLRSRGLRIKLNEVCHHIQNSQITSSIKAALGIKNFDIAIFALKSYDTRNFLHSIKSNCEQFPPILCLSNGVENEPAISNHLGVNKVIAGTVTTAIRHRDVGDIVLEKLRGVGVAEDHPLSSKLVDALNEAGLNSRLFQKASDMKWSKMLTNLLSNATSAILDLPPSNVISHPGLYHLEVKQLRETLKVMDAKGIRVIDLPGTPVRLLTFTIKFLPEKVSRFLIKGAVGSARGGKMPSFHIDLYSEKRKSEVDFLNGAVVREGQNFNIPTPVNNYFNLVLQGLTKGDIPIGTFKQQPEKFFAEFRNFLEVSKKQT
jgi:2-dehydropantoate 2-reductase